jgi:carbonic anhydrase
MEKLVIACMDRRLNRYLDTLNDNDTIFLRNAGGNVASLARSIDSILSCNSITRIHVVVHTDCGAMKVVAGARNGSLTVSERVLDGLVGYFNQVKFENLAELERKNEMLQRDAIAALASASVVLTSELLDISKVAQYEGSGEKVLAVTRASEASYESIAEVSGSDVGEMYTVQAESTEELLHDIEIATGVLDIHRVKMVALDNSEYKPLLMDTEALRTEPFLCMSVQIDCVKP